MSTRKAIEINPNFANAHSNLGNLLKDSGQLKAAEFSFRKAIEINPDLGKAHSNLGDILLKKGEHIEGIKHIKEGTGFIGFDIINGLSIN